MIIRLSLAVVIALSLSMCSPKKEPAQTETTAIQTFKSPYDTLSNIKLPLRLSSTTWNEMSHQHYEKFGITGQNDILSMPYGKVVDGPAYKAIIFIYDDPILITINSKQQAIDTLFLLGDNFSNEPGLTTIEHAEITSDLMIHLVDSIFSYDVTTNEERIESSEKLTINLQNYNIDNSGYFKRLN